jgi:hypothetical protein
MSQPIEFSFNFRKDPAALKRVADCLRALAVDAAAIDLWISSPVGPADQGFAQMADRIENSLEAH